MQLQSQKTQSKSIAPQVVNSTETGSHVSIYIPIESHDTPQTIGLKYANLNSEAKHLLLQAEDKVTMDSYQIALDAAFANYSEATNIKGIALFKSPGAMFHTSLSVSPPEVAVVATSFHLKPLMHCIASTRACYAIAISGRQIKVFKVEAGQIGVRKLYANSSYDKEIRGTSVIGQRKKIKDINDRFISETAKKMVKDLNIRVTDVALLGPRNLRRKLRSELASKSQVNIVLEDTIFNSTDEMIARIAAAASDSASNDSQQLVKKMAKSGKAAMMTSRLDELGAAAVEGRIEKLFVDPNIQIWGLFDGESGEVKTHERQLSEKDDCVIDDIMEKVLSKGGEVFFFDSSKLNNLAPYLATLRW